MIVSHATLQPARRADRSRPLPQEFNTPKRKPILSKLCRKKLRPHQLRHILIFVVSFALGQLKILRILRHPTLIPPTIKPDSPKLPPKISHRKLRQDSALPFASPPAKRP